MKLSLALLLSLHCVIVQASHRTDLATWEACIREPRQLDCNATTSCSRPLAQALGSIAVLIVFGLLHVRYQPYAEKHQNRLELVLIVSTACAALLSCAYPYVDGDAAKYAIDVLMLLLMFGPVVALLLWWGVACFKRRSRFSRFTRATARSTAQQRANAASIELDTESNNAASTGLATTPPAWGEQNRVQSRNVVRVIERKKEF